MRGSPALHEQRNRLYRTVREQGTLTGGRVLEESRRLDALVMRYYRSMTASPDVTETEAEREAGYSPETETDETNPLPPH